jgi:hypothetical protein
MFGMRRRIESKVNATLAQARGTMSHGDRAIVKASAALDELLELLDTLDEAGVEITLEIGDKTIPVKLRIKPGEVTEE